MTLFIDMDEVIADTYRAHISLYNKEFGENLSVEDCIGGEVWQRVPENRRSHIHRHCHEEGFFRALPPIEGSKEVIRELTKVYDVFIASAAMQFPNSFNFIVFSPTFPVGLLTIQSVLALLGNLPDKYFRL